MNGKKQPFFTQKIAGNVLRFHRSDTRDTKTARADIYCMNKKREKQSKLKHVATIMEALSRIVVAVLKFLEALQ